MRSCVPSCCFPLSPPLLLPPFLDVDVEEGGASHECVEIRQEPLHSSAPPPIHLGRRTLLLHLGGERGGGGGLIAPSSSCRVAKRRRRRGIVAVDGGWYLKQAARHEIPPPPKSPSRHTDARRGEEGPPFSVVNAKARLVGSFSPTSPPFSSRASLYVLRSSSWVGRMNYAALSGFEAHSGNSQMLRNGVRSFKKSSSEFCSFFWNAFALALAAALFYVRSRTTTYIMPSSPSVGATAIFIFARGCH